MVELDSGLFIGEVPDDAGLVGIARIGPSFGFAAQGFDVINASRQVLFGKDAQFDFSYVQPTAMFGGVMNFQPIHQASRLGRFERLVQGSGRGGVEVVPDQYDLLRGGVINIKQFFDLMGQVDRGLGFSDIDFVPSAEWLGKHEICRATPAFVLIVVALGLARLHSLGIARLGDQLGRLLIKTDDGAFGVVGTVINLQYVLHASDEFQRDLAPEKRTP